MADVPDQFVIRGVKNVMQGNRQFDYTETRAQMAAGYGDRVDGLGAQFVGNLL
jgi:hypothetical protein